MRTPFKPLPLALLLASSLLFATGSGAADLPKRKSGLWELKTQMEGMPSHGAMQMCVDKASDNVMQERYKEKVDCSKMEVKSSPGKVTIDSVCKFEDTTATTFAVITGDFEAGYKNDMRIRYTPPRQGMGDMHIVQEARWLGPCQPGQKPGDMIMPGMPGGRMNMQEMMNDPRIQEMMKKQRPGQ